MNKIAVLVSGQMRTLDKTYDRIMNIFQGADFYIHSVLDEDSKKAKLLKPKIFYCEPQYEMPERIEYSTQIGRGCSGVQRVLKQLWGLEKVWEIYENSGDQHDIIVRLRPDTFFVNKKLENLKNLSEEDKEYLYVPIFCSYGGVNDRFAFGNRKLMSIYFNRFKFLDFYIDKKGMFHPETFLLWTILNFNIKMKYTKTVFTTLRKDGTHVEPLFNQ
jgi:hypothetical protein